MFQRTRGCLGYGASDNWGISVLNDYRSRAESCCRTQDGANIMRVSCLVENNNGCLGVFCCLVDNVFYM
jgi:hypothetical protein